MSAHSPYSMQIPTKSVGLVIGKNGNTINGIETQTQTTIAIDKKNNGGMNVEGHDTSVEIRGHSYQNIMEARNRIVNISAQIFADPSEQRHYIESKTSADPKIRQIGPYLPALHYMPYSSLSPFAVSAPPQMFIPPQSQIFYHPQQMTMASTPPLQHQFFPINTTGQPYYVLPQIHAPIAAQNHQYVYPNGAGPSSSAGAAMSLNPIPDQNH